MNTQEIDHILRRYVRDFDGVFSADTLPEKPRLLVYNTDSSGKPGRHWICMHFEDGRGEYFDLLSNAHKHNLLICTVLMTCSVERKPRNLHDG